MYKDWGALGRIHTVPSNRAQRVPGQVDLDFTRAGMCGLFTDAVKVVGVLLFEHFPLPLTLAELRAASVQKLVDALQVTNHAPPPAWPSLACPHVV